MSILQEKPKTYICGHKAPDTDCTLAAICYAPIYQQNNPHEQVIPIVAGEISYQTKEVLKNAHCEPPIYMKDLYQRACDIKPTREYIKLTPNHPLASTAMYSDDTQYDFIVTTNDNEYLGILKAEQLIQLYAQQNEEKDITEIVCTPYSMLEAVFGHIKYINQTEKQNIYEELKLKVFVCTESLESFRQVTQEWSQDKWDNSLFIMGYNIEMYKFVLQHNPAMIILARSADKYQQYLQNQELQTSLTQSRLEFVELDGSSILKESTNMLKNQIEELDQFQKLALQQQAKTIVIQSALSTGSISQLVRISTPISKCYTQDTSFIYCIPENMKLQDIQSRFQMHGVHTLAVVDNMNDRHYIKTLRRCDIKNFKGVNLVLVDHNEAQQRINGADSPGVNIVEIVDHHKFAVFQDINKVTAREQGASCAIIAQLYQSDMYRHILTKQIALLLLSAIITDTVNFTSATTTQQDRDIAEWLQDIAQVNIYELNKFIEGLIIGFNVDDKYKLLQQDYKQFTHQNIHFAITQVEVAKFSDFNKQFFDNIIEMLNKLCQQKNEDILFLAISDMIRHNSLLLIAQSDKVESLNLTGLEKYKQINFIVSLPGKISRKKEILPLCQKIIDQSTFN